MNSRLTLGDLRTAFSQFVRAPENLIGLVNQGAERMVNSGEWKGNVIRVVIDSSPGYITLPAEYLSALGAAYNHWPQPIFGEFHTYFESGPGTPLDTNGWFGQLQDLGDGFPSQYQITPANNDVTPPVEAQPGTLVFYCAAGDVGKKLRIDGIRQETGEPVTDDRGLTGEVITLATPSVMSLYHYSTLTSVIKDVTVGPVTCWVLPSSGAASYQIATWLPGETRPRYRRYQTGRGTKAIQILCRRRFLPVRAETDWVIPGNLAAWKHCFRMLDYEDLGFDDKATLAWSKCLGFLNDEATASLGGAQPSIPAGAWGSWSTPIPQQH